MRSGASLFVTPILLLAVACGVAAQEEPLMETMPGGHTVYLTISPDAVNMGAAMISLGNCLDRAGEELPSFAGGLGFSPFDWSAWSDRLALAPGREMGMIIDTEAGDVTLVAFYIPTTDPAAVEGFFTGITTGSEGFDGVISMAETGNCMMVAAALDQGTLDASDLDLESGLGLDTVFSSLWGEVENSPPAVSFYLDGGIFQEAQGPAGLLIACLPEGSVLRFQILADIGVSPMVMYTNMIAAEPSGTDIRIPQGIGTAMRLSLNMPEVKRFLASQGLDRELGQGLSMFGLDSLDELLDLFTGDIIIGRRFDEDLYTGTVSIGLNDTDRAHRLLGDIHDLAIAAGNPIEVFEMGMTPFYRIDSPVAGGSEMLEIGIVEDALVITRGVPIMDVAGGALFSEFVGERGLGLTDCGGLLLVTDLMGIRQLVGSRASIEGTDVLTALVGASGSLAVDEGLFHARLYLEMSGSEPFSDLVEVVGSLLTSL